MDLAAVAVPAGFRANGLPFGVSLIGPAFSDAALLGLAERFADARRRRPAARTRLHRRRRRRRAPGGAAAQWPAHRARRAGWHSPVARRREYRLFALANTSPPKPGLVREPGYEGPGIDVEVWPVPADRFGSFVAAVPPPLAIGSVQLESGAWVKGFVCEPAALAGAREITSFGGWRNYLAQRVGAVSASPV